MLVLELLQRLIDLCRWLAVSGGVFTWSGCVLCDPHLLEFVLGCSQRCLLLFQLAGGSLQQGLFGLHYPVDAPVNLKVKNKRPHITASHWNFR